MQEWKLWAPGYMTCVHLQSTFIWNEQQQQKKKSVEYSKYNYLYWCDQYLRNHTNIQNL